MLVRERMTAPVVTVPRDTDYQQALQLMQEKRLRRLPVVDRERIYVLDDVKLASSGQIAPALASGPDIGRGRYGNVLLTNGQTTPVTATAARNAVERWRIVSAANARTSSARVSSGALKILPPRA